MMMYGVNAVSKEVNPTMQYLVEHRPTAGKFANRPFSFVVPFAEQGMQIAEAILCQKIKFIAQPKILREERNASGGKQSITKRAHILGSIFQRMSKVEPLALFR